MTGVTRRDVLKRSGQGALALGAAALVDGCGGGSSNSPPQGTQGSDLSTGGGKPVRGGTLTVSVMSGGPSETLDPGLAVQPSDEARQFQLYDLLFTVDEHFKLEPRLAQSGEPNKDATVWTLKLRDGVTWHDGKPFTADDVVFTIKGWGKPTNYASATFAGLVDFKHVRKLDKLTVEVPLLLPVADFLPLLTNYTAFMVQDGATPASFKTHPIGTGPFMFESFTPGRRSVFVRNPNYWEHGKPYFDRVVVDSSFTDEGARLNALLSGQTNALTAMPALEWKTQQAAGKLALLRSSSPWSQQIPMRVDKPPFNDVRVRQAMKYIPDRQAIINGALGGMATVGNDLFGGTKQYKAPYFLDLAPRPHDPEKAKSLLKAAGQENLTFNFPIAPALPGYVEMATLFAEQAKAAGVKVNLQNISPGQYFAYPQYPNRSIQVSSGIVAPSLTFLYRAFYTTGAVTGETHWGSPAHDKQLNDAIAETDDARAAERWREIQQVQYDQGGEIILAQADFLDATAKNVRGLKAGPFLPFNGFRFLDGWLA